VNSAADLLEMRVESAGPITAMDVAGERRRRADAPAQRRGRRAYEEAQRTRRRPGAGTGSFGAEAERSIVYRYVRSAT